MIANITINSIEIMGERSAVLIVTCQTEDKPEETFQLQFSELLSRFSGMTREEIKDLVIERIKEGIEETVNSRKQLNAAKEWLPAEDLAGKNFSLEVE